MVSSSADTPIDATDNIKRGKTMATMKDTDLKNGGKDMTSQAQGNKSPNLQQEDFVGEINQIWNQKFDQPKYDMQSLMKANQHQFNRKTLRQMQTNKNINDQLQIELDENNNMDDRQGSHICCLCERQRPIFLVDQDDMIF